MCIISAGITVTVEVSFQKLPFGIDSQKSFAVYLNGRLNACSLHYWNVCKLPV